MRTIARYALVVVLATWVGASIGAAFGLVCCYVWLFSVPTTFAIGAAAGFSAGLLAVFDVHWVWAGAGRWAGLGWGLGIVGGLMVWFLGSNPGGEPAAADWAYLGLGALYCAATGWYTGGAAERVSRQALDMDLL